MLLHIILIGKCIVNLCNYLLFHQFIKIHQNGFLFFLFSSSSFFFFLLLLLSFLLVFFLISLHNLKKNLIILLGPPFVHVQLYGKKGESVLEIRFNSCSMDKFDFYRKVYWDSLFIHNRDLRQKFGKGHTAMQSAILFDDFPYKRCFSCFSIPVYLHVMGLLFQYINIL